MFHVNLHGFIKMCCFCCSKIFISPRSKSKNHWSSWHKMLVRCHWSSARAMVARKPHGVINIANPFGRDQTWCRCMVILWGICFSNPMHFFGLVIFFMTPEATMMLYVCTTKGTHLELQTTSFFWLFQLDDSKSLHKKWLFHQTSTKRWLFSVPGIYVIL